LKNRIKNITAILDDKKAQNIETIDLANKGYLVDTVIIATALNSKHTASLVIYLKESLKSKGEEFLRIDDGDNWTIVDLGDILIHIMSDDYREKYQIEEFLNDIKTKTQT
jgi:ribosome silencing factor RsfS/YbeB/iojap